MVVKTQRDVLEINEDSDDGSGELSSAGSECYGSDDAVEKKADSEIAETVSFPNVKKEKRIKERKRIKKLTKREATARSKAHHDKLLMGLVKPDVTTDKEKERILRRIATKGVVQLFNAIADRQKVLAEELSKKMSAKDRKEAMDKLKGSSFEFWTDMSAKLPWLVDRISGKEISIQMYNDIDMATDYGCIFTSGCPQECTHCPLCQNSKMQVVEILGGSKISDSTDCHDLINCATACVSSSAANITMINHCLRHACAFHCFDGSCPKCSAFVTRVFNQMCVSGEFRERVKGFQGQCYEMFRAIVHAKFRSEFDRIGQEPAIGK
uniref:RRP15-like protein n=1 Tax=Heterorhabditis bacteriophora TaxID=37862 RepID=A0A1I7XM30_HETBA